MRAAGTEIVQRERVLEAIHFGMRVVFWALALLFTYQWLGFVLARFPYTRPWGEGFASFLVDTLFDMLSAVAGSVPGLIVAVLIFVLAHFANGVLRSFFDGVQSGRLKLNWIDSDSVRPTRRLVTIAVWLFAVAMAYPYIPGADTDAFKGLSVLLGLMVSVGASGIVGQAASGLILMYTRTFRPGEYVRVADHEGTVVALGMFTTRVRTGMGEELTLPNSMVLGAVTRNYSRAIPRRGLHRRRDGDDRLRHAVAAGARDADRGGAAHARACSQSRRRACSRPRCRTSTSSTGSSARRSRRSRGRAPS